MKRQYISPVVEYIVNNEDVMQLTVNSAGTQRTAEEAQGKEMGAATNWGEDEE